MGSFTHVFFPIGFHPIGFSEIEFGLATAGGEKVTSILFLREYASGSPGGCPYAQWDNHP
jgi:hypothetical protein